MLNSPNARTVAHSIAELVYQAEVAAWVGADTINIHGGGAYGDKPDALRVAAATERARQTWTSEPLFHISSPIDGWNGATPERHHDDIDPADFPAEWLGWPLTVEVEAKTKELAR